MHYILAIFPPCPISIPANHLPLSNKGLFYPCVCCVCVTQWVSLGKVSLEQFSMAVAIALKKMSLPSLICHYLQIFSERSEATWTSPFYVKVLTGLILWRYCSGNHSYCELSATVMSYPEARVPPHCLPTLLQLLHYFYPFCDVPWTMEILMFCLWLSIQWSLTLCIFTSYHWALWKNFPDQSWQKHHSMGVNITV